MLSDKIKLLRCEKGLSQEELAKELNVVRQTVSKWEKGLSLPDSDMLINIARIFDTTVSALLDEESPEEKETFLKTETINNKSSKTITIILLILGSPIWFSLVVAAVAVIGSLYVSVWSVIAAFWAVLVAFVGSCFGCFVSSFFFMFSEFFFSGLVLFAAALVLAGLSIFSFFGCKAATKGVFLLTKKLILWVEALFRKKAKEEAK